MTDSPHLRRFTFFRGRVALHAILRAMGIGHGDKVAVQAYTCLAVPEAVMAAGATPVWVDIESDGVNMDPDSLAARVGGAKAAVVQHTFGIPARMGAIQNVLEASGVPLVEDCCHTFSSSIDGRQVGSFGRAAFTSYEWGKPVVAGLGGSAVVDPSMESNLERHWLSLANPGSARVMKIQAQYLAFRLLYAPGRYWWIKRTFQKAASAGVAEGNFNGAGTVSPDFGLRMSPGFLKRLQRGLATLPQIESHAVEVARQYMARAHSHRVVPVLVPDGARAVYARCPFFVEDKPAFLARAEEAGVEAADFYSSPIHPLSNLEWQTVGYEAGSCPNAESAATRVVSFPVNQKVKEPFVDRVVELVNGY